MVQTRRRARQRGAALLRLPTDVLRKIATHTEAPGLVVAAGSNLEARTALRKGTDEAERSRFGGIGMTVREAEHILRTRYRNIVPAVLLESRDQARCAFSRKNIICTDEDHPDAPEDIEDWLDDDGQEVFVASRFVRTLLAYGADPSGISTESFTPLHLVAAYCPSDAIELARFLLAAGADIDAECNPADMSGTCAITWCITDGHDEIDGLVSDARCALATFLVEQGCDVAKADAGFPQANERNEFMGWGDDRTLATLFAQQSTPAGERLVDLITTALEEAGPERRQAAADAARQRFSEMVEVSQYYGGDDSDADY